tara:strand:+ start:5124 stop:5726 length:603 start_codon:yes stop_codon:yes gene_type:complete
MGAHAASVMQKGLDVVKKVVLIFVVVLIPALAWSYAKPIRLLLPNLNGMQCNGAICVEDPKKIDKAADLYESAVENLAAVRISLSASPNFIYCSTAECYESFGGGSERAISYPFLGTVIAPESWQSYITQHELIHWFQFSEIGAVSTMMKPNWFREGMAYVYSGAPESDIPEHYLPMMAKYSDWHSGKSWSEVIHQAGDL